MKRLPLCFPSEVSSRSTRDVGIMDLLSGLLVVKQILKLWPEKGFGGNRHRFCFLNQILRDFLTYLGFSISSLILNTMLYWCRTLSQKYISVRSYGLYNIFFSAFHSKKINLMINFLLYVFDKNDSNPPFHKERLPAIAGSSDFGWMFSHASTGSLQVKTFTQEKKNDNNNISKNSSNLSLLMLYFRPDRSHS